MRKKELRFEKRHGNLCVGDEFETWNMYDPAQDGRRGRIVGLKVLYGYFIAETMINEKPESLLHFQINVTQRIDPGFKLL